MLSFLRCRARHACRVSSKVLAKATKTACGRPDLHAIADKGYFSSAEILASHQAGIVATVPKPDTSGNRSKGRFVKADFAHDAERDICTCPAGEELTYRYTREEDGLQMRRYWTGNCGESPIRSRCTTGKERRIARWEHEHLVEAMRDRLSGPDDPMTLRRCTVEHPFGTIKCWMGATHFLTRGVKNVRAKMALNVLVYNIKRMVGLIGIRGLMAAIPG